MKQLFDDPETLAWAKRATAGIETSNVMLGFLDDHARDSPEYWSFALQVGMFLLEGKPLILLAPMGTRIPEKLRLAATVVEYFLPDTEGSKEAAIKRAFEAVGKSVLH